MNYKTTRTYACSFCNESGHTINKCQSEEISKLDQKITQIGLFDIILFVFSSLHLDENITLLTSELNKLSDAEKKVLLHLNREKSHQSKEEKTTMVHKLYNIYYLNKIKDYLNDSLNQTTSNLFDEILQEIKKFPKQKFIEYATQISQLYLNHEQLQHELQNIFQSLYPTEKKAPIKFILRQTTTTTTTTTTQECPICYDEIAPSEQMKTNCQHIYCAPCVNQFLYQETSKQRQQKQQQIKVCCPMCRTEITSLETQNQETNFDFQEKYCTKPLEPQEEQQLQNMYTMVATLIGF